MAFTELNSVENYIIHQLSGVNLNHENWQEESVSYGSDWVYKTSDEIKTQNR